MSLKRNRPILIQLLLFFALLILVGSIFLFRTIVNYGYKQFGEVINNVAKVANLYVRRSLNSYYEWQLQWLKQEEISSSIDMAVKKYYLDGYPSFNVIPEDWIEYQEDQLKTQFGSSARLHYDIFTRDRDIFYSSRGYREGKFSFFDNYSYFKNFDRGNSDREYLFGLGIDHGEIFIKLIIPHDSEYGRSYIAISSYGLEMNQLFNIEVVDAFPGDIYLINSQGQVYYNTSTRESTSRDFKLPSELIEHIKNGFNGESFKPLIFQNDKGESVIGIGTWIDMIGAGILLTFPANIIMGPSYYLASMILVTIIFFLLLALALAIAIDRKRVSAFDHNPLTHLPGNQVINKRIQRAFREENQLIVYLDLDNFKAYNDVYGFSKGDSVIVFTAKLLNEFISPVKKGFIGHIGGDDFVAIGKREEVQSQLERFGIEFDREIIKFYSQEDQERGAIEAMDRQGKRCSFPFISISMGGFEAKYGSSLHPLKIAEKCAEVKKLAKLEKGSKLIIDRRKNQEN